MESRSCVRTVVAFSAVAVVLVSAVPANALTSTSGWSNTSFTAQSGSFTAQFDAVPKAANMDGVTALSAATATGYTSGAVLVRFNPAGQIDARNGSVYAPSSLSYTAGTSYHFRLVVNMPAKTYSVYVTPQGGTELTLGTNYAFRSEQAGCTSLANLAMVANPGTHDITNLRISPPVVVTAGADQSVTLPAAANLNATVSVNGTETLPAGTTLTWTKVAGPGTVTFANAYAQDTTASFSTSGTYQLQLTASYNGQSASDTLSIQATAAGQTSSPAWQNTTFAAQTGLFSAEFDATPNVANMDGVTMLSTAAASNYSSGAVLVRFNSDGRIDARNGAAYAPSTISYTPGTTYHLRLLVNVPAKTYSAYVTPQGGTEQTLGTNLAFRSEQAGCANLANWAMIASPGTHTVNNFRVTPQAMPLTASAGTDKSITSGQSCSLTGSASGGTAPYTYSWTPTTGLATPTAATTTAAPASTQLYTLTVRDAAGQSATDAITVTVSTVPTNFYYVATSGNDANPGTAAAPWRTFAKAASMAQPGTTIIVKPGTYYETLTLNKSGTAGKLITFKSETPRGAVIDGQRSRSNGVYISGQRYVRIDGFEIRYHTGDAVYAQAYASTSAEGQEIANNYIHHNGNYTSWGGGYGIQGSNLRNSLIEGNEFYYNGDTAIRIAGGGGRADNVTIRGNSIHYNGRDGVDLAGSNIIIEFNHMYDQEHTMLHQDALQFWMCNNTIVRYNIMGDFTQLVYGGLSTGTSDNFVNLKVYGNVFYNSLRYARRGAAVAAVWIDCRKATNGNRFTGIQVHSNTFLFMGDKQTSIQLYGSSNMVMDDVRIYNNIFYRSGGDAGAWAYGIDSRFTNVRADYNCFYNVTANRTGQDTHSITADPRLTNYTLKAVPVDVRLQAGSPCINAGAPNLAGLVTLPSEFVDRDDHARPMGGNYDIGAFERQ